MKKLNVEIMQNLQGGIIACLILPLPEQAAIDAVFICIPNPCPPGQICPL